MSHKTKILFVHASDELYGSDVALLELVRRLDRAQFETLVVLPNDIAYAGLLSRALAQAGIRTHTLKLGVLRRQYLTPLGLLGYLGRLVLSMLHMIVLIHRERVDIVHSNTTAVVGGALAAWLTGRRHVWHVHEIVTRPAWLRWLTTRLIYGLSDAIVTVSSAARQHLMVAYPPTAVKLTVIYNGVDLSRYTPDTASSQARAVWGCSPDTIVIGMVGRIHIGKGHALLLEAAALVSQHVPQSRFVMVGSPSPGREWLLAELHAQAKRLALEDRVLFTGFRQDIPAVMHALDILVLPTTHPEAFGLVAAEAMAAGRPVIAAAHGGPTEIVVDGVTGLLVPPGQVAPLAAAITRLAQSAALRQTLGAAGRERVAQLFSQDRVVQAFETLYRRVLV